MSDDPARANIGGVVVTYNPDHALRERVYELAQQVDGVLVVDNGSNPPGIKIVHDLETVPKVELRLNQRNLGVAAALNQGAEWARRRGYRWLLLADQDTLLAKEAVVALQHAWQAHPEPHRIAVIGCNFLDTNVQLHQYPPARDGDPLWSEQRTVISAGSLLSLSVFEELGPLKEEFFIDHVDHEYCLRARSRGFKVLATRHVVMQHTVGAGKIDARFGVVTYNHSPERWYYMLRNEVTLVREYALREPKWVFITIVSRIRSAFLMVLFEKRRLEKLHCALSGFFDGILRRFPSRHI